MTLVWIGWAGLLCYKLTCWWRGRPAKPPVEERDRARYEAEVSLARHDALKPAEQAFADEVHALTVEWRTAEHPAIDAVRVCPLDRGWQLPALDGSPFYDEMVATATVELEAPQRDRLGVGNPALSGLVQPEPEPWLLESFTQGWTRAQFAEILAGASR